MYPICAPPPAGIDGDDDDDSGLVGTWILAVLLMVLAVLPVACCCYYLQRPPGRDRQKKSVLLQWLGKLILVGRRGIDRGKAPPSSARTSGTKVCTLTVPRFAFWLVFDGHKTGVILGAPRVMDGRGESQLSLFVFPRHPLP